MKRMFEKLYKYNRWRYEELFTSIEKQENFLIFLTKDSGLFFNSVLGTLKHLLAADYIWYGRIKQINEISIPLLEEKKIMSLNLKELILLWQSNDNKIFEQLQLDYFQTKQLLLEINLVYQQLIESVNEEWFEQEFQYLDSRGIKLQKDPQTALYHLINHHTHHLGQISTVYTQMYDRKDFFFN